MFLATQRIVFLAVVACLALASCGGCTETGASAHLECDAIIRRVKDGALEIGRRHRREPRNSHVLIESLRDRIAGYEARLSECQPDAAQTVAQIAALLKETAAAKPSGAALSQAIVKLVSLAESLPGEATPAAAYDD